MKRIFSLCLGLTLASAVNMHANAADYEAEQLIKYRQESMEAVKGHNNAIKLILTGKVPYDNQLDTHMNALEALLGDVGMMFPEGSDFGETNAKDGIWDNPEKFQETVKKAQDAFTEFKAVVARGDKAASAKALKKFGKNSCGSCHKSYKKKDD